MATIEECATKPVSLPVVDPTVSYWQDPPVSLARHQSTSDLPSSAEVVIIGSGITGATIAYHLLEQPVASSILMLEARTACSGATGRNGGHTKCASYRSFLDNVQELGEEEAVKIVHLEYDCMKAVHSFAREHKIECDSWEGDTVDVFYDKQQYEYALVAVQRLQKALRPEHPAARYHFWSPSEAESTFLTPGSYGAVSYEAGSLSAYKFVTGILALNLKKGLNLQTMTPATSLKQNEDGSWIILTPRGDVRAKKVILATNGYTANIYPKLQGSIVPLRGHVTAQRPGSRLPAAGLKNTYSFIYGDGYEYMITRPAGSTLSGDVIIGGGLTKAAHQGLGEYGTTHDNEIDVAIMNYLNATTVEYFQHNWGEDSTEGRVRKQWTGIMGYSADGFPLVGDIPSTKNLSIAASFQGHGMVLAFLTAKALSTIQREGVTNQLMAWFPKAFLITPGRIDTKFKGRLHTDASSFELKAQ